MKKVILITGASSGMGKVTAEELIKDGHTVYCTARDLENMKDLKKQGGKLLKLDVTNKKDCEKAVSIIIKDEKKIDVLWNNAGFGLYGPVEEVDIDKARYQFEVNLFGLAQLTQFVLPHMRKEKSGTIINTSSMGGKMYTPLGAWYHGTKHALEGWSDCLRLELQEFGIHVVILEPGLINTGFGSVVIKNIQKKYSDGPYKRIVKKVSEATKEVYDKKQGSSPLLIANTIKKIVTSKKPKTRYRVGKFAKLLVFMRLYLGDRTFDKGVMKQFNA